MGNWEQVFLVGKDFGAMPAYYFALKHPERALGVVTLGVPFMPPARPINFIDHLPEGFYISRWQVLNSSICTNLYHDGLVVLKFILYDFLFRNLGEPRPILVVLMQKQLLETSTYFSLEVKSQ